MKYNVLDLIERNKCCGCLACKEACPTGTIAKGKDEFGFTYPAIDESKCVKCGKCVLSCPVLTKPVYNYPTHAYAAINKNEDTVFKSSSGGIFSALAEYIIENGGVVCGAVMDGQYNVRHILIKDFCDIHLLQKSKYVQSDLNSVFPQIKKELEKTKVLFSGTPCQVAALKSFLGKEYDNLVAVDVVCHGVPNNELFKDYIHFLKKTVKNFDGYEFRAKKQVCNGMNWYSAVHLSDGSRKVFNWPTDSYNFYYMKCKIYRESCYCCEFAKQERASDITLCDYWGWEEFHKGDFSDGASVSGIIINSERGANLFNLAASKLSYVESSYQNISSHNQSLTGTELKPDDRETLLNIWISRGYEYLNRKFITDNKRSILKYKLIDKIPEKIKSEIIRMKQ